MAWPHDGPSWSPDGGEYWCKDRVIYWESGAVTDGSKSGKFVSVRSMDSGYKSGINYSEWTDEHRAKVLAERTARCEAERQRRYAEEAERIQSIKNKAESALAKLTDDEREAVSEYFKEMYY